MDLLYIMVIGKGMPITPNKWYLMFEKIVDQYDGCEFETLINVPLAQALIFTFFQRCHLPKIKRYTMKK